MLLVKKMKKYLKPIILVIIFSFLGLYFFYTGTYSEAKIRKEKELMEQMILKYEEDLANGIDVSKEDYTITKPDYSNSFTKTSLKLSEKICNMVDNGIKFIFKKINNMVEEE